MKNPAPEHKKVYVRFHTELDGIIEKFALKSGMKRASAIAWILERYMKSLSDEYGEIAEIKKEALRFVPEGEAYYIPIGRSQTGGVAGKRTIITIDKTTDRSINYLAGKFGMTACRFRAEILVKYFKENNLL